MNDGDTPDIRRGTEGQGARGAVADFPRGLRSGGRGADGAVVTFDRHELREIFSLYGRRVAEGEWKDYAIDFTASKAVFSIYRRASEVPLFRVEKDPALARKQGCYAIVASTGLVLKRGAELSRVLQVLEPKPRLVVV